MSVAPMLVEHLGGFCGWTKWDRDGDAYPCDKPSFRRIINGPEIWDGDYCKYHASRALRQAWKVVDDSD